MLGPVRDTELIEHLGHSLATRIYRDTAVFQRQLDILIDSQLLDQVETLEDETNSATPQLRELDLTRPCNVLAIEPVLPLIGYIEHAENRQ
jgi:uncharacterized membrane-anchored protein